MSAHGQTMAFSLTAGRVQTLRATRLFTETMGCAAGQAPRQRALGWAAMSASSCSLVQTLLLAFLFTVAFFLHILSCALYRNWYPMLILVAYLLAPIPLCLFARASRDDSFSGSGSKARQHWAEFLTSFLVSVVVGIPFVQVHVGVVELGAALLNLSAFLLMCITAGLAVFFATANSGDSLFGS